MKVKMILSALTEAKSPFFRPIKYSLFPPLGLATLAAYLSPDDEITLVDEHVEELTLEDCPDLVVIQAYITSAFRSYQIADHYRKKGCYVVMGGLHVTSLPDEAAEHTDTILLGPAGDAWTRFLADFRAKRPEKQYVATVRTLEGKPPIRRDLIKRERYLCPNSIVVSRGCPHTCDFCYKEAFYNGGRSFYTQLVDEALAEIERLPGKHVYFLDDHLLGNERFANALFDGMIGMGKVFQGASTVQAILRPYLFEKAAKAGMRSVFVGFETLDSTNLAEHDKYQNLNRDYAAAIKRVHDCGVMVNGSFVFGMDNDDTSVFSRTVDWAVQHSIETATFHIMTPYPSTELYKRMSDAGRMLHSNWDLYDTRHVVYQPAKLTAEQLERGYWRAYKDFYSWSSMFKSASAQTDLHAQLRHLSYAAGWKKFEPIWDFLIRTRQVTRMLPMLEAVLAAYGRYESIFDNKNSAKPESQPVLISLALLLFLTVCQSGWSQEQPVPNTQRAPLKGGVDLNAVQGDVQDTTLNGDAQNTLLEGGAGDWGGQLNGQQGSMDQTRPQNLQGGATGNSPLSGGTSEDADDSPELSIEWDHWRNTLMQTIQAGVLANINVHNDVHFVWDPRTQMMQSRYPNGTSAWYAISVLPNRKIINIRLTQNSQFPSYDQAVFQAINRLQGNKILQYPRGSKRRIVAQEGNVSTSPQSSFTNYNFGDVERSR